MVVYKIGDIDMDFNKQMRDYERIKFADLDKKLSDMDEEEECPFCGEYIDCCTCDTEDDEV